MDGWVGGQRCGMVAAVAFSRRTRGIKRLCSCATARHSSLETSEMDRKGDVMHERGLARFHGSMGYRGKDIEDGSKAGWWEVGWRGYLDIECKTSHNLLATPRSFSQLQTPWEEHTADDSGGMNCR